MKRRKVLNLFGAAAATQVLLPGAAMAAGPAEIRIGAAVSMTGLLAADGLDEKWSYEQAVADANAKGGIFVKAAGKKLPVKLVVADDGAEVPFQIWETLPQNERPAKPAVVMEDSPDGQGFGGAFKAMAQKHKVEVALNEPLAMGSKDYSAYILKMKARGVDSVLLFCNPTDAITLVRQMKEQNFSVPYFHGWKGTWTGEFHEALGKDSNYILADGFWSMDSGHPGAKALGERYAAQFKKQSVTIGMFYASAQVLLKAIENSGSLDSKTVRDAVVGHKFQGTAQGDVTFDANGLGLITSTANQWWDGRLQLVYPPVKGGWQLKLAPPWRSEEHTSELQSPLI